LKGSDVVVRDVSKFFDSFRALNNVSLEIKKGEFFSVGAFRLRENNPFADPGRV